MGFVEQMKPLSKCVDRIARGLTKLEIKFDYMEKDMKDVKSTLADHTKILEAHTVTLDKHSRLLDRLSGCKNFSPA